MQTVTHKLDVNCDHHIDGREIKRGTDIDDALDATGAKVGQRVHVICFGFMIEARYLRLDGRMRYADRDGNLRHWYQEGSICQG